MSGNKPFLYALIGSLALLLPLSLDAAAQQAQLPANVVDIRVEGNKQMSKNSVLNYVRSRLGEKYDEEVVKADEKRLLQSGRFESVLTTKTPTDKGVVITFIVVERPLISKLLIEGNKNLKDADLRKELPFSSSDAFNAVAIEAGRKALLDKYLSNGYYFAEVTTDPVALKQNQVVYRIVEGPKVAIRKLEIEGNHYFSSFKLKLEIGSKSRFWPFIPGTLDTDQIVRDLQAIRTLYEDAGYLDVKVDRKPPVFSADKKSATLTFVIDEGPRYRVGQIVFHGNTVFSGDELARRLTLLNLQPGVFYSGETLRIAVKKLQETYGENGFIEAAVSSRKQFVSPEASRPSGTLGQMEKPARVNIVFTIQENDQFRIGRIDITGNTTTQERIIRRELRFYPEQIFNTVAVEESRKRLIETRIFDAEKTTITPIGKAPLVRDVLVKVQEAKLSEFKIGVGVSTNSGLLGSVSFTQRDFDLFSWPDSQHRFWRGEAFKGAGQTLTITAEPGTELNSFYIDWAEPSLMDGPFSLANRVFFFERYWDKYRENRYGDVMSLGRRFPNSWYGEIAQRVEGVLINHLSNDAAPEIRDAEGTSLVLGTKGTLIRDRTDSRWMPSDGDRLRLSYEEVYGTYNFGKIGADYHIYRTLYEDELERKHVLSGKIEAAQILPDGVAPIFEEYYGGGIGSIRGFKYRGISPRSAGTDQAIGGDWLFLAGSEYEFPLIGKMFRGVTFLDSGTVEDKFGFTHYRVSIGAGLRLVLPFLGPVPMSLDFGIPLMKQNEDNTQLVSFSFGAQF